MSSVGGGRYRLDRRIASGGMGEVWQGTDTLLGRQVAIKMLHRHLADDETFLARFESEARHAAALHDPHIATVFDFGDEQDGGGGRRSFLVMEYVDGQPLSALLSGPLPPEQAVHLVAQAADALGVAHDAGIVHRDVKPANLLVTPDRRVKITDFGVARAKDGVALTDTGTIIGTPAYVAPEIAEGAEATPSSDIYSLGVVLYECLSGQRPFARDTPIAVAIAHLNEAPPPLPEGIPQPLRELVMHALAKDPAGRPPSGTVFAAQLRQAVLPGPGMVAPGQTMQLPASAYAAAPTPAAASTPTPTPTGASPRRRGVAWPLAAATAAIMLVVAAAITVAAMTDDGGGARNTGIQDTTEPRPTRSSVSEPPSTPTSSAPEPTDAGESTKGETPAEVQADVVFVEEAIYVGQEVKEAEQALKDLGLKTTKEELGGDGPLDLVADLSPVGEVPLDTEVTLYVVKAPEPDEDQGSPGSNGNGQGNDDNED